MTYLTPLLAQLSGLNPLNTGQPIDRSTGLVFRDLVLILVVGAALTLLLVLWARHYVRSKQRRRQPHAHSHSPRPQQRPVARSAGSRDEIDDENEDAEEGGDPGRRRRRRRRRRQRDHRPRNPTLAQTGGLPPPKGPAASSPGP